MTYRLIRYEYIRVIQAPYPGAKDRKVNLGLMRVLQQPQHWIENFEARYEGSRGLGWLTVPEVDGNWSFYFLESGDERFRSPQGKLDGYPISWLDLLLMTCPEEDYILRTVCEVELEDLVYLDEYQAAVPAYHLPDERPVTRKLS